HHRPGLRRHRVPDPRRDPWRDTPGRNDDRVRAQQARDEDRDRGDCAEARRLRLAMAHGIHHVTLITRKVQDNVDFYAGFLGLRLVKRTAGYEDANQLHLIYGDALGSPGTLVIFLVWEDGSRGRVGLGQISEISLAIEPASIGFWLTRALAAGIPVEGPAEEFGEPVLRLKDPDGIIVKM